MSNRCLPPQYIQNWAILCPFPSLSLLLSMCTPISISDTFIFPLAQFTNKLLLFPFIHTISNPSGRSSNSSFNIYPETEHLFTTTYLNLACYYLSVGSYNCLQTHSLLSHHAWYENISIASNCIHSKILGLSIEYRLLHYPAPYSSLNHSLELCLYTALQSRWPLAVPGKHQTHSCLSAFALVPSASGNGLPSHNLRALSPTSFRSLLRWCHIRKAFPDYLIHASTSATLLPSFLITLISYITLTY